MIDISKLDRKDLVEKEIIQEGYTDKTGTFVPFNTPQLNVNNKLGIKEGLEFTVNSPVFHRSNSYKDKTGKVKVIHNFSMKVVWEGQEYFANLTETLAKNLCKYDVGSVVKVWKDKDKIPVKDGEEKTITVMRVETVEMVAKQFSPSYYDNDTGSWVELETKDKAIPEQQERKTSSGAGQTLSSAYVLSELRNKFEDLVTGNADVLRTRVTDREKLLGFLLAEMFMDDPDKFNSDDNDSEWSKLAGKFAVSVLQG